MHLHLSLAYMKDRPALDQASRSYIAMSRILCMLLIEDCVKAFWTSCTAGNEVPHPLNPSAIASARSSAGRTLDSRESLNGARHCTQMRSDGTSLLQALKPEGAPAILPSLDKMPETKKPHSKCAQADVILYSYADCSKCQPRGTMPNCRSRRGKP